MTFAEVAGKIAKLYGLSVGEDIAVRFGVIRDGLIDDEPTSVAACKIGMGPFKTGLGREKELLVIERMLSSDSLEMTEQDWRRRTQEVVSLLPASQALFRPPSLFPEATKGEIGLDAGS